MRCVVCATVVLSGDTPYCSNTCEVSTIAAAKGQQPDRADFVRYENGDLTAREVVVFLGKVARAGLVGHLCPHYTIAVKSLRAMEILREDNSIDLDKHAELTGAKNGR